MGAINSISRSPRAVPRLVQKGFRKEVLSSLLLSKDFEAAAELKKLTVAWFSLLCCVALLDATFEVGSAFCSKSFCASLSC